MEESLSLLRELTEALGIPGNESEVRAIIRKHLEPHAAIEHDNLGSIIARKIGRSGEPRVMLAGHMDEIGFMVSSITKDGFIKFIPLGGWWEHVLLAQRVTIRSRKGDFPGVIGSKPPHILPQEERRKLVKKEDMFIDIGASSSEEAREWGIRPGDSIIPFSPFTPLKNPKLFMAKAWDDRVGCAMLIEVIRKLGEIEHPNTVYGVGTVQEEVGLRGAKTASDAVNPDIAFVLEVDIAQDVPGTKEEDIQIRLGKGPSIVLYDSSMISHIRLRDFIVDTAEEIGVPYQLSAMPGGGTDAGAIHLHARGVPSLVISVPTRYIHSHVGIIDIDDYHNAVKLIVAAITKLDRATVSSIKEG